MAPGTYYIGGYLYSGGKPITPTSPSRSPSRPPPTPTFTLTGPDLRHVHRRPVGSDPVDGRQRGRRQLGHPLLRHRHHLERQRDLDRRSSQAAANGNGSYNWDTTGVAPGTYYIGGYLYSGGKPTYSHLTQSITIQAATAPTFTLTGPDLRHVHRRPVGPDPVDGRQRGRRQHDQPLLRHRHRRGTATRPGSSSSQAAANGNGSYNWNTTGVAPGTYYIGGYLWSGGKPIYSHLTQSITIAAALTLAAPQEQVPTSLPGNAVLESQAELTPIVNEAIRRMASLAGSQVLASVSVQIADLPGNLVGRRRSAGRS